jgi:drug/metabolite transporter (DMT)-like permease
MTQRKEHLDILAVSLLIACCLFWGFQQVLVKATVAQVPPLVQASIRFVLATALLMLWCRWRNKPLFERDGSLAAGLLAGALFAAEFACLYLGLVYAPASRLTVFLYTSPFWVALLLPLFVRSEKLRPMQWLGLFCAFCAVAFALRDGLTQGSNWRGDTLALLAGLFWGLTTVAMRAMGLTRLSAEKMLFYQLLVSSAAMPMLSLALGEPWSWDYSAFAWGSIAVQTVVGAFASYLVWMWLLTRYSATKLSVFVFLTPVFALIFGAIGLNEPVTTSLVLALVLVALGIVLVNRRA